MSRKDTCPLEVTDFNRTMRRRGRNAAQHSSLDIGKSAVGRDLTNFDCTTNVLWNSTAELVLNFIVINVPENLKIKTILPVALYDCEHNCYLGFNRSFSVKYALFCTIMY